MSSFEANMERARRRAILASVAEHAGTPAQIGARRGIDEEQALAILVDLEFGGMVLEKDGVYRLRGRK